MSALCLDETGMLDAPQGRNVHAFTVGTVMSLLYGGQLWGHGFQSVELGGWGAFGTIGPCRQACPVQTIRGQLRVGPWRRRFQRRSKN
jgi:hypothetical protein